MYVCICHGITDGHIKQTAQQGCSSVRDLYQQLSLGSQCGKCVCTAKKVLENCQTTDAAMLKSA